MTAVRVRLAQNPPVSISRIVCDADRCHRSVESRYDARDARRIAREVGWQTEVRGGRRKPADYCPTHRGPS